AAGCEIGGCYAFWLWLRQGRSALWVLPGTLVLVAFGLILTRVNAGFAGRAFAVYCGIYIVAALCWLRIVEHGKLSRFDILGALLCLAGAALLFYAPRLPPG